MGLFSIIVFVLSFNTFANADTLVDKTSTSTKMKLSKESAESLRRVGLEEGKLFCGPEVLENCLSEVDLRESEFESHLVKWKDEGVYHRIFDTIGNFSTQQEKIRFLALVLATPESEIADTVSRVRSFIEFAVDKKIKAKYLSDIESKIHDLDVMRKQTEKMKASVSKNDDLNKIDRQKKVLLKEKNLMHYGKEVEIVKATTSLTH